MLKLQIIMEKKVKQSGGLRKRGRPAGKNRKPLSLDERRARNAQYERERREGMADALADLAAAAGCPSAMSSAELLATVISQFRQTMPVEHSDDLDTLRRGNENLMAQIEMLEQRLDESEDGCSARTRGEVVKASRPIKRKRENELPVVAPVPKRSPPECMSRAISSERKYSPPAQFPALPFLGPSSSEYYSEEQNTFQDSTESHNRIYAEAKYALNHNSLPTDPCLPGAAVSTHHFLPVPKVSPARSDQPEQAVNYCSFDITGAPDPTPEHYGLYTPIEQVSPSQYLAPETFHRTTSQQCPSGSSPSVDKQHLVKAIKLPTEFSFKEEHKSLSAEPEYLYKQEFLPADPWLPNEAMLAQNFLPELRVSPVSRTSGQREHNIDYSAYHFAGSQIPTPEYQIESTIETSEYIQPVQPYTEHVYYQSPQQCHSGSSSPEERFSPSQCLIPWTNHKSSTQYGHSGPSSPEEDFPPPQYIPEINYGVSTSQKPPVYQVPVQPNVVGSVEIIPMPGSSTLPDVSGAEQNLREGRFLSTEDLISMWF